MARKLKTDIPGRDFRIELGPDWGWEPAFADDLAAGAAHVLEIGYGRGEFLMVLAAQNPETAFLGIEVSHKRSTKMARRLAKSELVNIRLVCATAQQALDQIPKDSVDTCWINYPDPWPKNRHAKNRLLQRAFAERLTERVVPGGVIYIATDDRPYAEQVAREFAPVEGLENLYAPEGWRSHIEGRMPTAYELEWRAEGRPLHYFAFRRREAGA